MTAGLLADVLAVAGTGRFLPYDKDHRWSGCKDEHVFARDICPGQVRQPPSYEGVGVTDGVAQVDAAELTGQTQADFRDGDQIGEHLTRRIASRPGLDQFRLSQRYLRGIGLGGVPLFVVRVQQCVGGTRAARALLPPPYRQRAIGLAG